MRQLIRELSRTLLFAQGYCEELYDQRLPKLQSKVSSRRVGRDLVMLHPLRNLTAMSKSPGGATYDVTESPDALLIHLIGGELALGFDDEEKMIKALDSLRRPIGAFHVEPTITDTRCRLRRSGGRIVLFQAEFAGGQSRRATPIEAVLFVLGHDGTVLPGSPANFGRRIASRRRVLL